MVFYAVKRLARPHEDKDKRRGGPSYYTVSYIRDDGYFRGLAIFDNKKDAEDYMKIFSDRLKAQHYKSREHKGYKPIEAPRLKVFETDSINST